MRNSSATAELLRYNLGDGALPVRRSLWVRNHYEEAPHEVLAVILCGAFAGANSLDQNCRMTSRARVQLILAGVLIKRFEVVSQRPVVSNFRPDEQSGQRLWYRWADMPRQASAMRVVSSATSRNILIAGCREPVVPQSKPPILSNC